MEDVAAFPFEEAQLIENEKDEDILKESFFLDYLEQNGIPVQDVSIDETGNILINQTTTYPATLTLKSTSTTSTATTEPLTTVDFLVNQPRKIGKPLEIETDPWNLNQFFETSSAGTIAAALVTSPSSTDKSNIDQETGSGDYGGSGEDVAPLPEVDINNAPTTTTLNTVTTGSTTTTSTTKTSTTTTTTSSAAFVPTAPCQCYERGRYIEENTKIRVKTSYACDQEYVCPSGCRQVIPLPVRCQRKRASTCYYDGTIFHDFLISKQYQCYWIKCIPTGTYFRLEWYYSCSNPSTGASIDWSKPRQYPIYSPESYWPVRNTADMIWYRK